MSMKDIYSVLVYILILSEAGAEKLKKRNLGYSITHKDGIRSFGM